MSTYNKKLPKPSNICFINSNRSKRATTITMPFGGTIPIGISYMGWRQSSYAYSYQVQYMVSARMIPSKQLSTGTDITKTGWKYPNSAWSGDVNSLNRCVTQDKKNRYYRYFQMAGKSLMTAGTYDKLTVTIRVRSFNKTKKQHGAWISKALTVKCVPTINVYKVVVLADGGVQIYLNTNGWTRGDSEVVLKDVRHENALKKQNKAVLIDEVGAIGGEEAKDYPYAEFKGNNFDTSFKENENIVLKDCYFKTVDGVEVSIDGTYTIDPVSAVIDEPIVSVARDDNSGTITVAISKSDVNDDWDSISAWLECNVHNKIIRYDYVNTSGTEHNIIYFYFRPPLDSELNLKIGIKNNLGGSFSKTYTKTDKSSLAPILSNNKILINYTDGTDMQPENGMFNGKKVVAMNYEIDYSIEGQRPSEKELPHGRKRPIAFLGEGLEKNISVKGSIDGTETDELKTVEFSGYYDWLEFQEHQGIVLARFPHGRTYTALCSKLSIEQEDEYNQTRNISFTLEEVEV